MCILSGIMSSRVSSCSAERLTEKMKHLASMLINSDKGRSRHDRAVAQKYRVYLKTPRLGKFVKMKTQKLWFERAGGDFLPLRCVQVLWPATKEDIEILSQFQPQSGLFLWVKTWNSMITVQSIHISRLFTGSESISSLFHSFALLELKKNTKTGIRPWSSKPKVGSALSKTLPSRRLCDHPTSET